MLHDRNTTIVDGSVSVPLKVLDSDADGDDLDFPRLGDLVYKPDSDPTSRFIIKIRRGSGDISPLKVSASDTILDIKRRIVPDAKYVELITVKFAGESLANERTLTSYGISRGEELAVKINEDYAASESADMEGSEVFPISQSRGVDLAPEAEIRGLVGKARAKILYDWSGVMSDGQSLGLSLQAHNFIMIGRVVNKDWFEGYMPDDLDRCGYIPRNYVELESLYDEAFRQKLGSDAHHLPLLSTAPRPTPTPRRRWLFRGRFSDFIIKIFGRKSQGKRELALSSIPTGSSARQPPLPPSPFPPKPSVPIADVFEQGNRVRLNFSLEHEDPEEHPLVRVVLSLISAPQTRISYATVELEFEYDTIINLVPKREESAETEVHHTKSVANELSASGTASYGPVELFNLSAKRTDSRLAEYSRRTRGIVVGDGEGSSKAYWVFKEDSGEAARFGLDSEQKMAVTLHVQPVRVDYQVNARVVVDDGSAGGWFNTKRLSSGRQSFYFRH